MLRALSVVSGLVLLPGCAWAASCSLEGPPLGTAVEQGAVFAVATPVRVEPSTSGLTLREFSFADGVPDDLPDGIRDALDEPVSGETTVFEVERALLPDTPGTIEVYRPNNLLSSSWAGIELGRTGLYVFHPGRGGWRVEPYYELNACNGGYSLERVLHYAVTGEDDHWTAREVCGHTAYAWSRAGRYGLDLSSMSETCRAEYEKVYGEGHAVPRDRSLRYGQPLRRYGMD